VELVSTSADTSTTDAIAFLLAHKTSRQEHLPVLGERNNEATEHAAIDLSFVSEPWWPLVVPDTKPPQEPTRVARRWFELCAITQVMQELKSGDLCIPSSDMDLFGIFEIEALRLFTRVKCHASSFTCRVPLPDPQTHRPRMR
jgi:hypothetical protein